jgi:hypothetical protein
MAGHWTCPRVNAGVKCGARNERVKQKCVSCGGRRPPRRKPKHQLVLEVPYEVWVAQFGERCNLCGRPPGKTRLHRDHDHRTGEPRGLLCHRCNRALPSWMTKTWLLAAIAYLDRARAQLGQNSNNDNVGN